MKNIHKLITFALFGVSICYVSLTTAAPASSVKATKATIIKSEQLTDLEPSVVKFVSKYCLDCHNDKTTKGDRNFLEFLQDPEHENNHIVMEEMLDELNFGSMPEEKDGVPKPNSQEIKNAIAQMTVYLTKTLEKQKPAETPLRKLSKIEYVNSLRDLLHITPITNGAIAQFPKDPNTHGFTNISEYQTLSKHQLNLYVEAAKENIDKAIAFDKDEPDKKRYSVKPQRFAKTEKFNNEGVFYRVLERRGRYIDIGHGQLNERYPTYPSTLEQEGVHESGTYTITVSAEAIGRQNPYSPKVLKHDTSDFMKLAIGYGDNIGSLQPSTQSGRHLIQVFDLADNQEKDFTVNVQLPKGAIPYIYWINGPGSSKAITSRIMRKYHPEAVKISKSDREKIIAQGKPAPPKQTHYVSDVYRGPRVRVHKMVIEGPIETQWPPKSHVALVGNSLDPDDVDIPKALLKFANNAFRQPVELTDITKYVDFVNQKIADGTERSEAIKLGFNAILISPRFLYFTNRESANSDKTEQALFQQKQYELANRLSYMLWRSIPDEKLLNAAKNGQLATIQQLWAQADRMLLDAKAKAFTTGFLNAWLRLDKLGEMPPGERQYSDYYRYRLETAMRKETEILFTYILNYNLPVSEFLTADYTFINDGLAKLYDIKNVYGESFQKVQLPENNQRRGLLGHASILTASANGVDTSPVLRGVWVLESILGTPPPPPPPDVPTIEPDTRGATTIREQLEKHRNIEACADCHANIDPWGFPLENYDPIGKLRQYYPHKKNKNRAKIDNIGIFKNGDKVKSLRGMNKAILDKEALFTRNLVKKMLTFAVGKEPTFRDEAEIQSMVKLLQENGNGMKALFKLAIASDYFYKG